MKQIMEAFDGLWTKKMCPCCGTSTSTIKTGMKKKFTSKLPKCGDHKTITIEFNKNSLYPTQIDKNRKNVTSFRLHPFLAFYVNNREESNQNSL